MSEEEKREARQELMGQLDPALLAKVIPYTCVPKVFPYTCEVFSYTCEVFAKVFPYTCEEEKREAREELMSQLDPALLAKVFSYIFNTLCSVEP